MTTDPTGPALDTDALDTDALDTDALDTVVVPPAEPPADDVAAPVDETRPELLIGGAFLGGMIVAKLLGRRRG